MALKLTENDLKQIGEYLEKKYPLIKGSGRGKSYSRDFEIDIRERIVRVEEELKNQREILNLMLAQMDKRFEMSEKRFEQVDKRFEQVDKRFEELRDDMNRGFKMMMWFTGLGFTFMTSFITGIFIYLK